ncbi:hypothetical protein [Janthinobacterium psychrotolerans]|uniref:Uncharacterized protein n=1 Tax=Janthinobacterium psychrotolerans TaxID=1747903 RepID=A0A1A7C8W9_9BURK|nr:hypothetical protein [Janthinobacterium psychrotolerans]OBV40763.1 hypothetical protein ASR47_101970 [Janthinobacterium psychrotolerans]
MSAGERAVPLEQAREGAILSRALRDASGTVLLAQGAVLTAASLAALRRRGVKDCWIVAAPPHDGAAEQAQLEAMRQRQLARLAVLFRATPADAPGAGLLALLQRYRQGDGA